MTPVKDYTMGKTIKAAARRKPAPKNVKKTGKAAKPATPGPGHNNPPKDEATAAQLAIAADLGWRSASSDILIGALYAKIESVGSVKAVKLSFWDAYIARRMNPKAVTMSAKMLAEATIVRKMKVEDRDETQKKHFDGARKSWSRLTAKAKKIGPTHGNAGNTNAKKPAKKPERATVKKLLSARVAPSLPVAKDAGDIDAYVNFLAAQALKFINANASTARGDLKTAVQTFHDTIKAIVAKKPDELAA